MQAGFLDQGIDGYANLIFPLYETNTAALRLSEGLINLI